MKIYSDTLTFRDLDESTPPFCYCEGVRMPRPRIRRFGWTVYLRSTRSRRHANTGRYDAGEEGAASYDQHGEWFAALYRLDPNARITYYENESDFHAKTDNKYKGVQA